MNDEESISPFANQPVGRVRQRTLPRRQELPGEALGKNLGRGIVNLFVRTEHAAEL
jgi:hypothetical protein